MPDRRWKLSLIAAATFICSNAYSQEAQRQATVVFFTPGNHWRGASGQMKTLLFGKADIASMGSVYDGKARLASLTHTRYIALQIAPGTHTLSANLTGNHPKTTESVTVDLKPGSVTYFAVTTTVMNYAATMYMKMTSHIENATCADFAAENTGDHLEQVDAKHVTEEYRNQIIALSTLPACSD